MSALVHRVMSLGWARGHGGDGGLGMSYWVYGRLWSGV